MARFNGFVARGVDEDFGRGDEPYDRAFSGGAPPLYAIEQPPFHAAAFGISDLGTKGGLRTDTAARVLDPAGSVIGGLYAAGNTMAAPSGTTYPGGGNPIGTSMVFSHLAVLRHVGRSEAMSEALHEAGARDVREIDTGATMTRYRPRLALPGPGR